MLSLITALSVSVLAPNEGDFEACIDHLLQSQSYTFKVVRESDDDGDRKVPPLIGKYQAGEPTQFIRGDQVLYRKGDELVLKSVKNDSWRKVELSRMKDDAGSKFGRETPANREKPTKGKTDDREGNFDRSRFMKNLARLALTPMPHEVMQTIGKSDNKVECTTEGDKTVYSGSMPIKAIVELVGWDGNMEFLPNFEGTFQYFCTGNAVEQAKFVVEVIPDEEDESGKDAKAAAPRLFTVTISDIGSTKVDITVEGRRMFNDAEEG